MTSPEPTGMSAELLAAAAAVSSSSGAMGAVGTGSTGGGGSNGSASGASSGSSSSNGSVEEAEMRSWERDPEPEEWEQELQRELLLIQRQQYIQKQLLISEFHKQHQNLLRQHQAQLQEHIKLQQALLTLRQQQEALDEERRQEAEEEREREEKREEEREQELHRREQQHHHQQQHLLNQHRKKERSRESAMASTEVRQKLHDFLLSKSAKEPLSNGTGHPSAHRPAIWYMATQHMSVDQSSPPLGETPPTFKSPLPTGLDGKDDFPLRKTASEPNLKVRSRLKQKVAERRSGPIPRRRDGSVLVTPHKMRALELNDSSTNDSSPGSGPSSPIGYCGADNMTSYRPSAVHIERCLSQTGILKAEGSMALLNLYTSPSLPNLTLSLQSGASPISAATALKERAAEGMSRHSLGAVPPVSLETKVNNSHQALLQHLLLKDQIRQQKILSPGTGSVPVLPLSPLAMKERAAASSRPKLPRHHRPLNRTQSAPLPQSTLAQLVLQQQHQNFVEKQKQYQQQVHLNQILSQSIEHLRHPSAHLQEEDEESGLQEPRAECATLPSGGVIRHLSLSSRSSSSSTSSGTGTGSCRTSMETEPSEIQIAIVKVKEEPSSDTEEQMDEGGRESGGSRGGGEAEVDGCLREVKTEDMSAMTED
ncbi:histone deacetylase 9-B isoform X2 [Clupea harengus]|uniref:histone deacetylase n=1 Tax=Clupea harengus TaxID=7950 RepID=A0A6P3W1I4_CLUHA|nr:histone deacetylase 9-B isoform X2 [Clupea harengus]XP_031442367.1 histone deacetylase 9-B isoform X2 [Clupea harengus]